MLVVRSQRKVKLLVDDVMYFIVRESNKYIICASKINNINNYNYTITAEYSTEEKALKVLDMLETFINEDYEKLHNLGYKQCIVDRQVYGIKKYKLTSLSYQFPKDEEVE